VVRDAVCIFPFVVAGNQFLFVLPYNFPVCGVFDGSVSVSGTYYSDYSVSGSISGGSGLIFHPIPESM
jgi:hypothetical protein